MPPGHQYLGQKPQPTPQAKGQKWQRSKLNDRRRTIMRWAHKWHKDSGHAIAVITKERGQFFVYSSDLKSSPLGHVAQTWTAAASGTESHTGVPIPEQHNPDAEFPPPLWHIRRHIPAPLIWHADNLKDVPYHHQFKTHPRFSRRQPGGPTGESSIAQAINPQTQSVRASFSQDVQFINTYAHEPFMALNTHVAEGNDPRGGQPSINHQTPAFHLPQHCNSVPDQHWHTQSFGSDIPVDPMLLLQRDAAFSPTLHMPRYDAPQTDHLPASPACVGPSVQQDAERVVFSLENDIHDWPDASRSTSATISQPPPLQQVDSDSASSLDWTNSDTSSLPDETYLEDIEAIPQSQPLQEADSDLASSLDWSSDTSSLADETCLEDIEVADEIGLEDIEVNTPGSHTRPDMPQSDVPEDDDGEMVDQDDDRPKTPPPPSESFGYPSPPVTGSSLGRRTVESATEVISSPSLRPTRLRSLGGRSTCAPLQHDRSSGNKLSSPDPAEWELATNHNPKHVPLNFFIPIRVVNSRRRSQKVQVRRSRQSSGEGPSS